MAFKGNTNRSIKCKRTIGGNVSFFGSLSDGTLYKRVFDGVVVVSGAITSVLDNIRISGTLFTYGTLKLIKNGVPVGVSKRFTILLGKMRKSSDFFGAVKRWIRI